MGGTPLKIGIFFANNLPKRSKSPQLTNNKVCRFFIYLNSNVLFLERRTFFMFKVVDIYLIA